MKIKFGAIVVDGRGKIGGHVASKNRGGAYLRTKVTPTNPQTTFQSAVRNRLTAFSQGWRGLTQAQRDAWNAAVSNFSKTDVFGDIKQPTGLNLYVKLNSKFRSSIGSGNCITTITSFSRASNYIISCSCSNRFSVRYCVYTNTGTCKYCFYY